MRTEYTLKSFFSVLKVAQCQIKLLKGNENWDYRERLIMGFKIDLLQPYQWRWSGNRGEMTFKRFQEFKDIFGHLLPGLTKANLRRIMYEARKYSKKIRDRRENPPYVQPITDINMKWDEWIGRETHKEPVIPERLTLDNMFSPKESNRGRRSHFREAERKWRVAMDKKYRKVVDQYLKDSIPDHEPNHIETEWRLYRDGNGRTGLGAKINYRLSSIPWTYKDIFVPVRTLRMIEVEPEEPPTCIHEIVPFQVPRSLAKVSVPQGGRCKKCGVYVNTI